MALQDAIKRLRYIFTSEGADKVASDIEAVNKAQSDVAVTSSKAEQASLSLEKAFGNLERRFNTSVKAQQDYQKVQNTVNAAVAQNPALQERANVVLAAAAQRYEQASVAQRAFAQATSGVSGQLVALSAGAGPVGVFLSSLGPWGLAAAAGIGLVSAGFHAASEAATTMGEKAIAIRQFSDVTGIAASQIGALRRTAAESGVDGEKVATAYERLTANLAQTSRGSGTLYDDLRRVNAGLAAQVAAASTVTEKINLIAQAYKNAGDESAKAELGKAAFGKGGGGVAAATLGPIADVGGIQNLKKGVDDLGGATDEQIQRWAKMQAQIDELNKSAKNVLASIFTDEGLQLELTAAETAERVARALKDAANGASGLMKYGIIGGGAGAELTLPLPFKEQPAPKPSDDTFAARFNAAEPDYKNATEQMQEFTRETERATALSRDLVKSQKELQDAAAAAATKAQEIVSALGAGATAQDHFNARVLALKSLLADNVIKQQDYQRAVQASDPDNQLRSLQRQQGVLSQINVADQIRAETAARIADVEQLGGDRSREIAQIKQQERNAFQQIETSAQRTLQSLENQAPVAAAVTGADKIRAQAAATYNDLMQRGVSAGAAAAIASQQMANGFAAAEASAQGTLLALQDQNAIAGAVTGAQKLQAEAQAAYNKAIRDGASATTAAAIAAQTYANGVAGANAQVENQIHALRDQDELLQVTGTATEAVVRAQQAYNNALRSGADESHAYALQLATLNLETDKFNKQQDQQRNSNVQVGVTELISKPIKDLNERMYGPGGVDYSNLGDARGIYDITPAGKAFVAKQGAERSVGTLGPAGAALNVLNTGDLTNTDTTDLVKRMIDLLPSGQQAAATQMEIAKVSQQPETLARDELLKSLNDSLKQLQQATDANTDALKAQLDPLFSQGHDYIDKLKIGYFKNADGGMVGPMGQIPLMPAHQYADGGVAASPQLAMFGEAGPEAFIPLKGGAVPVTIKGGTTASNDNSRNVTQYITQNIAIADNVDRRTARQRAQGFIAAAAQAVNA